MRHFYGAILALALASSAVAAPPSFDPPAQVPVTSGIAVYMPPADCVSVKYIGLDGEEEFPLELIGGSKTGFAFIARGLPVGKVYRFVGVASSATGEQVEKLFTVKIPDGKPPPVDPPNPPDPPVTPATFYFYLVRPDGPAAPTWTAFMSNPAWKTIEANGHQVKDFEISTARKYFGTTFNTALPPGTALPAVIVLRIEGGKSFVHKPAAPIPADPLKLLEGVK